MAGMNNHTLDSLEAGPSVPKAELKFGMNRSTRCNTTAPIKRPRTATHGPPKSIDGTSKLKEVAVNMTPAANPSHDV